MSSEPASTPRDRELMSRAIAAASAARWVASPLPWVGAVLESSDGELFVGATEAPGGRHAEVVALEAAGDAARGSTLYVTLEPCAHHGTTPPCAEAIIEAGVSRVVVAVVDPDPRTDGAGIARLDEAGVQVESGLLADQVEAQLTPYLHQRRTGLPYVVLKLAASLDGFTAAPDGTSQWITGKAARSDAHRLRAESDGIIVGAGTVRRDDPSLTVRDWRPPTGAQPDSLNPVRIVFGAAPADAMIRPCLEMSGDPEDLLRDLAGQGMVQVLCEGGAALAGRLHRAGLVDRYVFYLAPALFGGDDARGIFTGPGVWSIDDLWRGSLVGVERLGDDLRIDMVPARVPDGSGD